MQKQRKYSETEMIVVNAYWRLKMRAKKNECVCTLYSAVASPLAISILFSINVVPYDIALGSCFLCVQCSLFHSFSRRSHFFLFRFTIFICFCFWDSVWVSFGPNVMCDGWMVELPTTTITTTATLFLVSLCGWMDMSLCGGTKWMRFVSSHLFDNWFEWLSSINNTLHATKLDTWHEFISNHSTPKLSSAPSLL